MGQEAEAAKKRRGKMSHERDGPREGLDTVTGEEAKCQGQMQGWADWYAHHRKCCLLSPKERPVGAWEDLGSTGVVPHSERFDAVFGPPSLWRGTACPSWS